MAAYYLELPSPCQQVLFSETTNQLAAFLTDGQVLIYSLDDSGKPLIK